jgi:hypothetical protein
VLALAEIGDDEEQLALRFRRCPFFPSAVACGGLASSGLLDSSCAFAEAAEHLLSVSSLIAS